MSKTTEQVKKLMESIAHIRKNEETIFAEGAIKYLLDYVNEENPALFRKFRNIVGYHETQEADGTITYDIVTNHGGSIEIKSSADAVTISYESPHGKSYSATMQSKQEVKHHALLMEMVDWLYPNERNKAIEILKELEARF